MNNNTIMHVNITPGKLPKGETNWDAVDAMSDEEAERAALADPDAPPTSPEALTHFQRAINVKLLRESLGLTQEEFAMTFHLSLQTIRDWEQGIAQPDPVARTLLRVIAHNPEGVKIALIAA